MSDHEIEAHTQRCKKCGASVLEIESLPLFACDRDIVERAREVNALFEKQYETVMKLSP